MRVSLLVLWCAAAHGFNGTGNATNSSVNGTAKVREPFVARCHRVRVSHMTHHLKRQNRSLLIVVQTMTPTKSNICEGLRADWREGLGQCLARMTGLRTIAHNDDGSCADCLTLKRTSCEHEQPPGLIAVLGGGEAANQPVRFHCTGTYCRNTHESFPVDNGNFPPFDYRGACMSFTNDRRGNDIFAGRIDTSRHPPTQVMWFPILNPRAEMRGLFERSSLFATNYNVREEDPMPEIPPLPTEYPRSVRRYPKPSDLSDTDYQYLKLKVEPAFERAGHAKIDIVRDDAFAKPLLLPPLERAVYLEAISTSAYRAREPTLIYSGQYRPNKGQLDFLRKLDAASLGPFVVEMFGYFPLHSTSNLTGEWYEIKRLANSEKLSGKIIAHNGRIPHILMMGKMATASGLIHFSSSDRNPRVLYEALYFGLPLFVSIQSMPYIGLQCKPFVQLADVEESAADMNRRLRKWTRYLVENEKVKHAIRLGLNKSDGASGERDAPAVTSLQQDIHAYVADQLTPQKTFAAMCERLGFCEPSGRFPDPRTPWVSSNSDDAACLTRKLWRYENWKTDRWNASKHIKHTLNISNNPTCTFHKKVSCRDLCIEMNERDSANNKVRPWWMPNFVEM